MIKQIKVGFQMLQYGFGIKMCLAFMGFFLLVGLLLSFLPIESGVQSSFFILVNGLWASQLIYSLGVSNLVQTSPWKKRMETSVPALVSFAGSTLLYLIMVILRLPYYVSAGRQAEMPYVTKELIIGGMILLVLMLYMGMAYKLFVISTVLFFVTFIGITLAYNISPVWISTELSFGAAVGIGFLEIAAGALGQYGISLLVYKFPPSKKAQMRGLQKWM